MDTSHARQPQIIPRADHSISRNDISGNALKVLYRLNEAGFHAFLVGGAVRDILLGLHPKDFDVATDAEPEEVRRIFRNSRLIGRRFRLAHVYFGDEIIEVATFRASTATDAPEPDDEPTFPDDIDEEHRVVHASGRILRDNLYGTIDDDVWRRDFTANALYYNIADYSIWDYVDGVADIRARVLRVVGDPATRFREDPVRMLRAIRFAAKLGFTLAPETAAPIATLKRMLAEVPAARLFDETMKMFLKGAALATWRRLREFQLDAMLFPGTARYFDEHPGGPEYRLLERGLESTDARIAADKAVTPTFLFAVLLYAPIREAALRLHEQGAPETQAYFLASDHVLRAEQRNVSIPKRFTLPMRELLALQPRFRRRDGRKALALLEHPRFRAAYDFLLLRCEVGLEDVAIGEWWTNVQTMPQDERQALVEANAAHGPRTSGPGRRRRRRGRRSKPSGAHTS
ncbi:MAG TPA: polynucleotide adenylyltransferase PcnB [Steroidobacteraceae bacterium]|nr:polynucleotide adenylyltransferase PcnB [Steroidobacteraceae bacterium]